MINHQSRITTSLSSRLPQHLRGFSLHLILSLGVLVMALPFVWMESTSLKEWDQVMAGNLRSAFLCSKWVYPAMKTAGGGKIINIGSMTSYFGGAKLGPYSASKGSIVQMTRSLAKLDIQFEKQNPLTVLMSNVEAGCLKEEVLEEKVLSAIIEIKLNLTELPNVLQTVERVAKDLATVISVGVASRCDPDGSIAHENICREAGFPTSLNGKTNLGLGKRIK